MLVKKTINGDIVECVYDSSNILASKYNKESSILEVTFKKGTKYAYSEVSSTDYTRFELADSQGKVFSSHIKNKPTTKVGEVDVINETKAVKEWHDANIVAHHTTLKGLMNAAMGDETVDMFILNKIEAAITNLKKAIDDAK